MPFGFGKKGRGGQGGNGSRRGGRLRFGRGRASLEADVQEMKCICPECGLSVLHKQRVQCYKLSCPQCGSAMTRGFSDE